MLRSSERKAVRKYNFIIVLGVMVEFDSGRFVMPFLPLFPKRCAKIQKSSICLNLCV